MKNDPKRATGRTLGLALQALGKAIENPGTEIGFVDHHAQNHAQYQFCKERIEKIAKQLNLDVSVKISYYGHGLKEKWELLVKSNWVSPYSQRTSVEEAFKSVYGYYPDGCETSVWIAFQKGFEAAQK